MIELPHETHRTRTARPTVLTQIQTQRPIRNQFPVAAAIDSVTPILHADFANRYVVPITAGYHRSFTAKLSVFLSL